MKTLYVIILLSVSAFNSSRAQSSLGYISFDAPISSWPYAELIIDTDLNPSNIWQIGRPQKAVFDSAFTYPNAIVTDTINVYPVNDTSSFIIKQLALYGWGSGSSVSLSGFYYVNSDTITDFGLIEVSPNNGQTWVDILKDTSYNMFAAGDKPVLSGNSGGWVHFKVNFEALADSFSVNVFDTVLLRFTFISDSVQSNKDGLMFDAINLEDWIEGIKKVSYPPVYSKAFPNPVSEELHIEFQSKHYKQIDLAVFDSQGRQVKSKQLRNNESISIDIHDLPAGSYHYSLTSKDEHIYSQGRFTKAYK